MRRIAALLLSLPVFAAQPLAAQQIAYEAMGTMEEIAPAEPEVGGARLLEDDPAQTVAGIAAYGPFRVLDSGHAALVDVTDATSPEHFAAMLRDHPGIATIEMITCPGTEDDRANLRLGLMIRERGMATRVPAGGFVGSGAVELFLAGARRYADVAAQFAFHSWEDEDGREAQDYAPDAPQNRAYLDYYRALGMSETEAQAFYAMTNSVPFESAKWLTRADLAQWVKLDQEPAAIVAVLDLPSTLQ
jgi:hypothetical protein